MQTRILNFKFCDFQSHSRFGLETTQIWRGAGEKADLRELNNLKKICKFKIHAIIMHKCRMGINLLFCTCPCHPSLLRYSGGEGTQVSIASVNLK